ncbi:cytochrome P450 [Lasiosphaeris hirsuta]|uniref:Cytochrome P450 n=1 Tax=Lasiosphaeris hirsuta TaxID=260670 RepID=A0AA40A2G6_9PEZI|nr:cytochrome P450 [Lasiosphaeris hirsuta]
MAPSVYLVAPLAVISFVGWFYWKLFPTPLPGIPYTVSSLNRVMGDALGIKENARVSRESSAGIFAIGRKLGSPIAQVLITSFSASLVIVDDPREAEDILIRRNREFDRSPLTTKLFKPMLPHSTLSQMTTPALKSQKRLWSDVMGGDFLRRVVAPNIHIAALELVELWRIKARQAEGEPLDVTGDFGDAALDAIYVAILGSKLGVLRRRIYKAEAEGGAKVEPVSEAEAMKLESAAIVQQAMEYVNEIVDLGATSIYPPWTFFWLQLTPTHRRFKKIAHDEVRRLMVLACERFRRIETDGKREGDELETCAMDLVLRREIIAAKKSGKPAHDPTNDPAMIQELLLLLLAGHDSTANTLSWFVKIMALHPTIQTRLRAALTAAFPSHKTSPAFTAAAILDADIPYLEATLEETVRFSATSGIVARLALVDTEVLGRRVPAGTNVLLNTRVLERPYEVAEHLRSATSQAAHTKRERGGIEGDAGRGLDLFEPARWLVKEGDREVFDAYALPNLIFGGGLRGCFGKRLAMQELKIIMVDLMLNFEFLPLPEELSSMAAVERVFRAPRMCYVKLKAL